MSAQKTNRTELLKIQLNRKPIKRGFFAKLFGRKQQSVHNNKLGSVITEHLADTTAPTIKRGV